jgi:hypothetical protein
MNSEIGSWVEEGGGADKDAGEGGTRDGGGAEAKGEAGKAVAIAAPGGAADETVVGSKFSFSFSSIHDTTGHHTRLGHLQMQARDGISNLQPAMCKCLGKYSGLDSGALHSSGKQAIKVPAGAGLSGGSSSNSL